MEQLQPINAEQEAQQKEYKRIKDAMKADIKYESSQQNAIKQTLKQPHGTGSSAMQQNAHLNRVDLRHLFIAYTVFRIQGGRQKDIPETKYIFNKTSGTIIRMDGKAIINAENAPRMELITKILEKYGASIPKPRKTVHLNP